MTTYHHSEGIVVRKLWSGPIIDLKEAKINVIVKYGSKLSFQEGEKVIVSWASQYPDGLPDYQSSDHYIYPTAVENPDKWLRSSQYEPKHDRDLSKKGFLYEDRVFKKLTKVGWRVERSTPFEDEKFGVDCWIHYPIWSESDQMEVWDWVPVDITSKGELYSKVYKNKLQQNNHRGIITLLDKKDNNQFIEIMRALVYGFIRDPKRQLITREFTMAKEERYVPPKSHGFETKRLVLKKKTSLKSLSKKV